MENFELRKEIRPCEEITSHRNALISSGFVSNFFNFQSPDFLIMHHLFVKITEARAILSDLGDTIYL